MAGANNPALMGYAGNQATVGMTFFLAHPGASRTGNAYDLNGSADSEQDYDDDFFIPELGISQTLGGGFTAGLTVYANGGMDTEYEGGQIPANHYGAGAPASNLLCGRGSSASIWNKSSLRQRSPIILGRIWRSAYRPWWPISDSGPKVSSRSPATPNPLAT